MSAALTSDDDDGGSWAAGAGSADADWWVAVTTPYDVAINASATAPARRADFTAVLTVVVSAPAASGFARPGGGGVTRGDWWGRRARRVVSAVVWAAAAEGWRGASCAVDSCLAGHRRHVAENGDRSRCDNAGPYTECHALIPVPKIEMCLKLR